MANQSVESTGLGETPLKSGVLAFLDALGFKGIWSRHEGKAAQIVAKLERAIRDAKAFGALWANAGGTKLPNLDMVFLSDTLVIACHYSTPPSPQIPVDSLAARI